MPDQLSLHAVSKSYAFARVLEAVTCTVRPGEKVGVVGENGAGKSTLLRLIAGEEPPDDGTVTVIASGGVGTLRLPPAGTVGDAIDLALADLRDLERLLPTDPTGELIAEFERRGGWTADVRIRSAMSALGVGDLDAGRDLATLSGGQRARLAVAGALAAEPELLLLDEPTNHLDAAALTWLEDRLRAFRGTLVLVTHDRLLLERVTTAILEVDGDRRTVIRFGNGYAGYLAEKRAARARWEQAYAEWVGDIAQWTGWSATTAHRVAPGRPMKDHNKCKYNGDGRRVEAAIKTRVRNAAERLDRLRAAPVPRPPDPLRLRMPAARPVTEGVVLAVRDVRVPGRLQLDGLVVRAGERILIDGPNGAGKSTLFALLAGMGGRIGWLPQESGPGDDRSLLTAFGGPPDRLAALGLFHEEDFSTPVRMLSAGQRRRLALARLFHTEADVLLLDEPTNHLSPALGEELTTALEEYPGAVVLATHDRALRARWGGRRVPLEPVRA